MLVSGEAKGGWVRLFRWEMRVSVRDMTGWDEFVTVADRVNGA